MTSTEVSAGTGLTQTTTSDAFATLGTFESEDGKLSAGGTSKEQVSQDSRALQISLERVEHPSIGLAGDGILDTSPETVEVPFFLFQGERFEPKEKDKFLEAAANNVQKSQTDHWKKLEDEAEMTALAHKLFHEYAGENLRLSLVEMTGLAISVAAELGINPRELGNPHFMFYRHDFDGTDELDEEEGVQMVTSMLRYHRDLQAPEKPGQPKLIKLPYRTLQDHFELKKRLGKGGQGTVYLATDKASSTQRVVKSFSKESVNCPLADIKDEFRLLKELDHPRVARVYDIFEDRRYVYLISEPYMGGDLQSLVPKARDAGVRVTNRWLGRVLQQVLQGVAYLHKRHVMHCDLKEANAMICKAESWEDPAVVVIDFGLADKLVTKKTRGCGTPGYIPPEVWLKRLWTIKGDVHCLGVMIYQMFAGETCFPGRGALAIQKRTIESDPDLRPLEQYGSLNTLLSAMLHKDFKQRPTVTKAMESPFFTCLQETKVQDLPSDVVNRLCQVAKKTEIEAAILVDIADMQNLCQLRELNEAFMAMDSDHSGVITEAEARSKLNESLPAEQVQGVLEALLGDDGQIAYTEFMGKMLMAGEADLDDALWREFQVLDTSGEGCLGEDEIAKLLERPALCAAVASSKVKAADLMVLMDKDSSGQISFEEFRLVFRGDKKVQAPTTSPSKLSSDAPKKEEKEAKQTAANPSTEQANVHNEPVIDVRWRKNKMVLYGTKVSMENNTSKGVAGHCFCMLCCCWWLPLVFLLGAENTTDDLCEMPLGVLMRVYACVSIAVGPCIHYLKFQCSNAESLTLYRIGHYALLGWPFLLALYSLAGIVVYAVVSDERCLRPGRDGVNPMKLILVWPIVYTSLFCLILSLFFSLRWYVEYAQNHDSRVLPEPDEKKVEEA